MNKEEIKILCYQYLTGEGLSEHDRKELLKYEDELNLEIGRLQEQLNIVDRLLRDNRE